jgi:PAS domain
MIDTRNSEIDGISWNRVETAFPLARVFGDSSGTIVMRGSVGSVAAGIPRMTHPFGFDPDRFKTAPVRRLAAYWLSKCAGERVPRRTDILPEEIVRDLPFVYLVDVLQESLAFRFRLVGTQVAVRSDRDHPGVTVNAAEYESSTHFH